MSGAVASADALERPDQVLRRLLLAVVAVALLTAGVLVAIATLVVPGDPGRVTRAAAWLGGLLALAMAACGAVAVAIAVRRASPLYRALSRRLEHAEGAWPPPSEAATRDALAAPARVAWAMAGGAGLVAGAEGLGLIHVSALAPAGRLALALVAFGIALGGLPALAVACRRVISPWVRRFAASELTLRPRPGVARRVTLSVLGPVAAVGLAAAGAAVAAAPAEAQAAVAPLALGVLAALLAAGLLAAWLALGLGRRLATDLRALTARVEGLASGEPRAPVRARTRQAAELAAAVEALADRYARSTEQESRARDAIEEAQRLKNRFMAFMSHDLRSPLNSIRGFAEVLARGTDGSLNEAQRESVTMIQDSGEELLRLVTDVLDWAKLEAGRLELHRAWTPSVEIVTAAVQEARTLPRGKTLELVTDLEPGLPPVYVDRDRVVQAVAGVLGHVMRVMREGTIRLRARRVGDRLRIEVIDASKGIRREDRERLFEAFRAVRQPSGRRVGGLGLGLSLARGLATAHGGDLWYERREDGRTVFCVALPL